MKFFDKIRVRKIIKKVSMFVINKVPAKDKVLSFAIKKYLNKEYKEYFDMLNLSVNTKNKSIIVEILLKGEANSLSIQILDYELFQKKDGLFIKFGEIQTSREWMNLFFNNYLEQFKYKNGYPIPEHFAPFVEILDGN